MATDIGFVEYVCEQVAECGHVTNRKMFGEYMVYVNLKPLLLLCDNTVFIKKIEAVADLLADASCGFPYKGAKEHYILDIDDRDLSVEVVRALDKVTPLPKPKK